MLYSHDAGPFLSIMPHRLLMLQILKLVERACNRLLNLEPMCEEVTAFINIELLQARQVPAECTSARISAHVVSVLWRHALPATIRLGVQIAGMACCH